MRKSVPAIERECAIDTLQRGIEASQRVQRRTALCMSARQARL